MLNKILKQDHTQLHLIDQTLYTYQLVTLLLNFLFLFTFFRNAGSFYKSFARCIFSLNFEYRSVYPASKLK